jgi:Putative auto-transporter adhesin, head GIN domain
MDSAETASASPQTLRHRRLLLGGLVAALFGGAALARTVGSGREASESRPVADFDAIAVSDSIDLVVRQAEKESLTLTADDNVLPLVETVVEAGQRGRTLVIRLRRGESLSTRRTIKATVDVVRLTALASAGSGNTTVGALKTPSLRVSMAGSGDLRLDRLTADALEVRVAGSGDVTGAGTADQVKLTIAGSGDVDLASLAADHVTVSIAGSGDAKITANQSLSVKVAGSGDVVYGGAVKAVRTSVAGSGTVTRH